MSFDPVQSYMCTRAYQADVYTSYLPILTNSTRKESHRRIYEAGIIVRRLGDSLISKKSPRYKDTSSPIGTGRLLNTSQAHLARQAFERLSTRCVALRCVACEDRSCSQGASPCRRCVYVDK